MTLPQTPTLDDLRAQVAAARLRTNAFATAVNDIYQPPGTFPVATPESGRIPRLELRLRQISLKWHQHIDREDRNLVTKRILSHRTIFEALYALRLGDEYPNPDDLNSDDFATRAQAQQKLRDLARTGIPAKYDDEGNITQPAISGDDAVSLFDDVLEQHDNEDMDAIFPNDKDAIMFIDFGGNDLFIPTIKELWEPPQPLPGWAYLTIFAVIGAIVVVGAVVVSGGAAIALAPVTAAGSAAGGGAATLTVGGVTIATAGTAAIGGGVFGATGVITIGGAGIFYSVSGAIAALVVGTTFSTGIAALGIVFALTVQSAARAELVVSFNDIVLLQNVTQSGLVTADSPMERYPALPGARR